MRKIKIIATLSATILLSSIFTGCGTTDKKTNIVDISYNIESENEETKEIVVKKFNLGKSVIKEKQREVPFEIEGVLGIPKEINEKTPIVFIFHGQHSGEGKADFEDGFTYLVENFAKNGIIAISVDDQVNHTWEFGEPVTNERVKEVMQVHLDNIIKANNGESIPYGVDLKGKIDLANIGLVGHSLCGEGIFKVALDQQKKGFNGIKALLSITPAAIEVIEEYPDITTSIIVSEYDGDVMDSGASIYDNIVEQGNRKNQVVLNYLIGGNHNYFNTVVENNKELSEPQKTNGGYPEKLTNIEQRDFIMKYSADFMGETLKGKTKKLLDNSKPTASTIYGRKVLNKVDGVSSTTILNGKEFQDKSNDSVKAEKVIESYLADKDQLEYFTALGYKENIELIKIKWEKNNSSINFDITEQVKKSKDEIKGIRFRWALDSTDKLNSKDKNIALKVNLKDKKGKVDSIALGSNTSALKYFEGEYIKSEEFGGTSTTFWSRKTPIMDSFIPSILLKNIDLSKLENIEIEFIEPTTGVILLEDVSIIN